MTPLELTEQAIQKLLADLAPEFEALDRLAEELDQASGPEPDAKADAAARAFLALQIHNYFTAAEKVLERIVRQVDGVVPEGESWHRSGRVEPAGAWLTVRFRCRRRPGPTRADPRGATLAR